MQNVFDEIYRAPSHLRRAQIYARTGDRENAIMHYTRFVKLWEHADAELQVHVEQARRRIEELRGEPAGDGH
jgi:hypothetical protein